MAKALYVKLQTPSIELPVKAVDPSGVKDSIQVGFVRAPQKESTLILKEFSELSSVYLRMLLGQPLDGKATEENKETEEYSELEIEGAVEAISKLLAANILYIKQAKLVIEDDVTGKDVDMIVPDTRKAKPNEDFWETPEECLAALLGMYLSAAPWRSSLLSSFQKALLNMDFEDGKLKN